MKRNERQVRQGDPASARRRRSDASVLKCTGEEDFRKCSRCSAQDPTRHACTFCTRSNAVPLYAMITALPRVTVGVAELLLTSSVTPNQSLSNPSDSSASQF